MFTWTYGNGYACTYACRYMVLVGEVEVTMRCDVSEEEVRLGFLSEGAFFGEAPVLAANSDVRQQMRTRTVRAVTRTELCYLTREAIMQLCEDCKCCRSSVSLLRAARIRQ